MAVGLIAAFFAVMSIACVYVPSFTSSVLKLRSGLTPSLKSNPEDFADLRGSPDSTAAIFGISFWSCLYTSGITFFLASVVFFVCVFPVGANRLSKSPHHSSFCLMSTSLLVGS